MASLTGSTIASSYEQLLSLPDGGLNGNTLVAITDGDSSTAIGMKVATSKIEVIPASDDANAFEVSQADGTAVFTVNTSSPAFTLTGNATITTADNTDTLKLISTDADASVGPSLNFYRNSGSPADSDNIGILKATGRNDNSQDVDYVLHYNSIGDASDGTEDGRLETYVMLAGTNRSRVKMDETEIAFNNDSVDLDFRVESDNATHALFVQGSDGNVGIGTDAPAAILHVKGAESKIVMEETDADKIALISSGDGDFLVQANSGVSNDNRLVVYKTSADVKVSAGNLIIGTVGKGIDFSAQTATSASGATTTAELLDHYEEGTWTIQLIDGSSNEAGGYEHQQGSYVKIGRSVHISGYLHINSLGSMSGALKIHGLPFTTAPADLSGGYTAITLNQVGTNMDLDDGEHPGMWFSIDLNAASGTPQYITANGGNAALTAAQWTLDGEVFIGGHYISAT